MDTQEIVLVSKVPMLKPNEFDMWKIRIRQYMLLTDYGMWEVVENGPGTDEEAAEGGARPPPRSDADRKTRQTEMKALSTLLLAIPNEYQHQFNAKALWTALEKRFSGTKSTKRSQKAILKQQYENFTSLKNESMTQTFDRFNKLIGKLAIVDVKMDKDDVNRKFLRSLGEEWTIYIVSFRQDEHNKKQKEAFLSAQAARRLASDFVEEDDEISADPLLAQKAALKVFNRNAEEQAEEVNTELDWCRDRLHLRKHGAAISGIRLRRTRGKRGNPGKTWITVKRSGVKDVEHTLDKLDRYNLSDWNEIRSLLPKANKNYKAEVEEVINGLIARIRRTTEIPDDLLQPSSAQPMPPVRRSAGTSTRRPTPCMPRTAYKPLDLSMLDLSFPSGVSLSEGQVIREPVHGICVGDNFNILRFQRFSELHKAPTEHLVSILFIAQKEKKNKDNKEFIRAVRAILDHRIANGETPFTIQVKTEELSEDSDS
ncbi:hypothetical protein OSB04_025218 [Centaurea solstitialis]|uniref:Uncharacterized protein n=1 Tax=Centaurea solstitialis TaxID=347529 RepID=A0AA38WEL8_9ASTR|nr:hypothetical protein OSB04_025218 [Centaurea solstitialis]